MTQTFDGSRLSFAEVQGRLNGREPVELDPLHRSLNRDYQVLTYLLDHAASLSPDNFERRILALDYHIMRFWYRIARVTAPSQAHKALAEMAAVLAVLSQKMSGQTGARTQA